jgi:monooxygenase
LNLKFLGGLEVEVDGKSMQASDTMIYKGMMCSDVPNLSFAVGYTNASWTLKCDLTSEYVCRLLNYMESRGYTQCCPRNTDPTLELEPILNFTSSYVLRAIDRFPKQGNRSPWKLFQNYVLDRVQLRHAALDDGAMEFSGSTR